VRDDSIVIAGRWRASQLMFRSRLTRPFTILLRQLRCLTGKLRRGVADIFGHVRDQRIEFLAGRAAERILLDGEPVPPVDDLRQARELAALICSSEEAVETFLAHCDVAARDLLMPYGDVVMALSVALRIRGTMKGAEIDDLISDVQTRKVQAIELARRADWKRRELSARAFGAEVMSRD